MVMAEQSQVWVGSEDSVIYIINVHSMSCNKQLTDHRASVTGLAVQDGLQAPRCGGLYWVGRCLAHGGSGSQRAGSRWPWVTAGRARAGQGEQSGSVRARGHPCVALVVGTEKWSEDMVRDPPPGEHGGHAVGPSPPRPFPVSGVGLLSLACGRITGVLRLRMGPLCACPAVPFLSGCWSVAG